MTVFRREQPLSTNASSARILTPRLSHSPHRVFSRSYLASLLSLFVTTYLLLTMFLVVFLLLQSSRLSEILALISPTLMALSSLHKGGDTGALHGGKNAAGHILPDSVELSQLHLP